MYMTVAGTTSERDRKNIKQRHGHFEYRNNVNSAVEIMYNAASNDVNIVSILSEVR